MNTSMKVLHNFVVLGGDVMQRTGENNKMSACVFAFVSIILFMPAVGSGAGTQDAPEVVDQKVLLCLLAIDHATRAVKLGTEGLVVDATEQTSEAVKLVAQAIELLPSRSDAHSRHAAKHLRASKNHLHSALKHWEKGNLKQALDGVMLGRDYAEASILHTQCKDFVCR